MKIGDLCEVVRGSSPRPKSDPRYYGGTVPRLMVADLTRDGKIVSARIDSLTELGAKQSRLMQQGDMVIAVSGAPGLPAILAHEACIHDGFVGLRNLDLMRICPNFLYSYLRFIRTTSNSQAVGAIFKNLTTDQIKGIDIPELPLEEQRRIAEVLDRAQELKSKRRQAIAQLDTLTQAIFLEMFGDPNSIFHLWKIEKFGDLLDFITTGSRGWAAHYAESGDLFLRIQNVRWDELVLNDIAFVKAPQSAEARRTQVQPGDVLLSMTADIGRTAVIPEGIGTAYINQHLAILRTKSIHPQFLSSYFASPSGRRQVQGRNRQGVKAGLNFDDVRSFMIPSPPLSLQQEFASRVETVEKLKTAHRSSLSELDTLFASLQDRAFRGEHTLGHLI